MSSLIQVAKGEPNPFIVFDTTVLYDIRLSWKAKGLYAYLISLPDTDSFSETQIAEIGLDGRTSIKSGLQELIDNGYLAVETLTDDEGNATKEQYQVFNVEHKRSVASVQEKQAQEQEAKEVETDKSDPVPFQQIMDLFNSTCGEQGYSSIVSINGKRKEATRARYNEFGIEGFEKAFSHMCESTFLRTGGNTDWKGATYDWAVTPTYFQKLLERSYLDEREQQATRDDYNSAESNIDQEFYDMFYGENEKE